MSLEPCKHAYCVGGVSILCHLCRTCRVTHARSSPVPQVACPRLSIDWGEGFALPTLTPYEAMVALGAAPEWWDRGDDAQVGALAAHADRNATDGAKALPTCSATGFPRALQGVDPYPMDYYAKDGGEWSSSYLKDRGGPRQPRQPTQAVGGV